MKYCAVCGEEMSDLDVTCLKCGQKASVKGDAKKYDLCCPDEQVLATLGNDYGTNLLYGNVKKCRAVLTDKRVYFQGEFFKGNGKGILKENSSKIIDLEDITGTGFIYSKNFAWWIYAIVAVICSGLSALLLYFVGGSDFTILGVLVGAVVPMIVGVVHYLLSRKVYFMIEYAGGGIKFNAAILGLADVNDFQNQIRRAKDKVKGK